MRSAFTRFTREKNLMVFSSRTGKYRMAEGISFLISCIGNSYTSKSFESKKLLARLLSGTRKVNVKYSLKLRLLRTIDLIPPVRSMAFSITRILG
jgi:hypothetical protein